MAKTQKYSNELLNEAVERYADWCKTKIKATELAAWARSHVPGLEDVRDYHFTRPVTVRDQSGKKSSQKRPCTIKIEEINENRRVEMRISRNILLQSSDIEEFFKLPKLEQRKYILETRAQVDDLVSKNIYLETQGKLINAENKRVSDLQIELQEKLKVVKQQQATLENKLTKLIGHLGETGIIKAFGEIGLREETLDLIALTKSMNENIDDVFSINNEITRDRKSTQNAERFIDDIISGFDF